jgi:hypothetical protein
MSAVRHESVTTERTLEEMRRKKFPDENPAGYRPCRPVLKVLICLQHEVIVYRGLSYPSDLARCAGGRQCGYRLPVDGALLPLRNRVQFLMLKKTEYFRKKPIPTRSRGPFGLGPSSVQAAQSTTTGLKAVLRRYLPCSCALFASISPPSFSLFCDKQGEFRRRLRSVRVKTKRHRYKCSRLKRFAYKIPCETTGGRQPSRGR